MNAKIIFVSLLCLLLVSPAYALRMLSGNQVSVDSQVNDDIFASGGEININAPVASATIFGGTVNINAPISGDLFVAGGNVAVNSNVGGKIVAAGGNIDLKGSAVNAVLAGGNIVIEQSAVIQKDAIISGNNVVNNGKVIGNLTVRAGAFQNSGTAGNVDFKQTASGMQGFRQALGFFQLMGIIGFLIVGLILLKLFPRQFQELDAEIRESSARKAIVGFIMIIAAAIVLLLLAITIIGIPLAIFALIVYIVALVISPLFVSLSLGKALAGPASKTGDMALFIIGFIVLNILMLVPFIGGLIRIIAVSLGFGAMYYALRRREETGKRRLRAGKRQNYAP